MLIFFRNVHFICLVFIIVLHEQEKRRAETLSLLNILCSMSVYAEMVQTRLDYVFVRLPTASPLLF